MARVVATSSEHGGEVLELPWLPSPQDHRRSLDLGEVVHEAAIEAKPDYEDALENDLLNHHHPRQRCF